MIKYEDIKGNAIDNLISELKTVGKAVLNDNIITINQPGDGVTTNDFFTNCNKVCVRVNVDADLKSVCLWVVIIKNDDTEELYKIVDGAKPGKIEGTFDSANFAVYADAKKFRILLDTTDSCGNIKVNSFEVSELSNIQQSAYYDEEFEPMITNVFNALDRLQAASVAKAPVVVSPSGKKFTLSIDDSGNILSIPNIPNKTVFIGNSLLGGMGFYGMCASNSKNDYFHYVSQAILDKNPEAEFVKIAAATFEGCEDKESFEDWWTNNINRYTNKTVKDSLDEDVDLILVQLGDNVNSPERADGLNANISTFISQLRNRSPKARIIWILGWYNRSNYYDIIAYNCAKWNIPIVDLSDLNTKDNQATKGQMCEQPDGTYAPAKDGWITHPGDKGMKLIADRIIKMIDM